ncbi:MAG TPA: RagB/SusD family nutrient uptake outer membrane protein [Cytophagales bacterium]|nr:RagB/SusD family nutrient uptake outer membrane protein [Cytophagales bacterium]
MIKYKIHTLIFALALLATSCESILEVKPKTVITDQIYWQNESDYTAYLVGIYSNFRTQMNDQDFGGDRSDSFVQGSLPRFSAYWAQVITPENSRDWKDFYGVIGHANLLLEKSEGFEFSNEGNKSRIKAEALALRAAMYFYMAKIWGDVPLVLDAVVDENVPQLPRTPVADVFNQINADIDAALALFPEEGFVSKYRFSKPAVYALKADVKMWSASVLGGGDVDYNAAIAAIDEVAKSGVALQSNFSDITEKQNNEIILAIYFNRSETGGGSSAMYARYAFPLSNYSGEAENAEELPLALDPNNAQAGYAASPQIMGLFSAYPNDERIASTYVVEIQGGKEGAAWPNKFQGTRYADDRIADDDIILYRWADLLLLKAEAYAALNQPENALIALNEVRERAKIDDYTSLDIPALKKEILDERGRELFHENKRWWDLVRAHKSGVVDIYQYIPNLVGKTTPIYWPVSIRVLSLNKKIVQTEGYQ